MQAIEEPETGPVPERSDPGPASTSRRSRASLQLAVAFLLVLFFSLAFAYPGIVVKRAHESFTEDLLYTRALYRFYIALLGGFLTAWLVQPSLSEALQAWRARLSRRACNLVVLASVTLSCLFVTVFLVHFGRQQYGGWDYNILVDVGWRQLLGQRPYIDFVTPTPPFFNWTAALAFRFFGVNWNANLYLAALFSSGTLVWSFFLLRRLGMGAFAALATALVMQTGAMLTCCFWWYNNSTLIIAALFYLAAMVIAHKPGSYVAQVSYVLLLGLLPLTKPNIAGITVVGCVLILLLTSKRPAHILLLTLGGILCAALWFAALHVPITAMIASYRGVARERGATSYFGFSKLSTGERCMTVLWMTSLCLPLLSVVRPLANSIATRRWRYAASWFFFPLAIVVAAFGIAGNGELRDVECTCLIVALAVLAFVYRVEGPLLRRLTVALICGMVTSDLYTGSARLRVYTIGPQKFFEWHDHNHLFTSGFLQDLRGSEALFEVDQQIRQVVSSTAGPVFLGPRIDFEYAALGLPSPTQWTSFFEPGTSFARTETPYLVQAWANHRFGTLVFLKGDYTVYPRSLMQEIDTKYTRDDHYPRITVYHRSPGT